MEATADCQRFFSGSQGIAAIFLPKTRQIYKKLFGSQKEIINLSGRISFNADTLEELILTMLNKELLIRGEAAS